MITIRKAESDHAPLPGSWFLLGEAPLRVVCVRCAACGRDSTLHHLHDGSGHQIAADGTVHPSIVCPHAGCSWHVWGRLDGWSADA